MVDRVKGRGRASPAAPSWAGFTIVMVCSGHCHFVCTLWITLFYCTVHGVAVAMNRHHSQEFFFWGGGGGWSRPGSEVRREDELPGLLQWAQRPSHAATKIQNKCSQKMKLCSLDPISAFMYLWASDIFPRKTGPPILLYSAFADRSGEYIL
jgi:hypothetical protein